MNPRDWLMLLIAYEGAPSGLDPVRLQKGMFLFAQEAASVPQDEKYDFRPYNYGPMSKGIYDDLDLLVERGLVEKVPVEGQSWSKYKATPTGLFKGQQLVDRAMSMHPGSARHLFEIKRAVATVSFAKLLEDVYERYPDYATASIFQRRKQ